MGRPKLLTDEVMDRAIKLLAHFDIAETAEILGMSPETINRIRLLDRVAAEGNAAKLWHNSYQASIKEWAAKRHGIPNPWADTKDPDLTAEPPQKAPAEIQPAQEEATPDNTALCVVRVLTLLDGIAKVLEEINAAAGRANGRLANVELAISQTAETMRQNINANCDILHGDIGQYKDVLNGIQGNTRPRRAQDE